MQKYIPLLYAPKSILREIKVELYAGVFLLACLLTCRFTVKVTAVGYDHPQLNGGKKADQAHERRKKVKTKEPSVML